MIFTLDVFQTVGKFSEERIIDKEFNREYTLKNLEKATSEELKMPICLQKTATLSQTTSF